MKTIITIEIDGEEVKVSTEKREIEEEVIKHDEVSVYARFFDESCVGWSKNSEYNLMFLRWKQLYANDLLRAKGHLLLNDVYRQLGIPESKAGCVVGWIYDENNPLGDNFVDFGLNDLRNKDFINGYETCVLLDFNVNGVIVNGVIVDKI